MPDDLLCVCLNECAIIKNKKNLKKRQKHISRSLQDHTNPQGCCRPLVEKCKYMYDFTLSHSDLNSG